jgi:hypothetical protein
MPPPPPVPVGPVEKTLIIVLEHARRRGDRVHEARAERALATYRLLARELARRSPRVALARVRRRRR